MTSSLQYIPTLPLCLLQLLILHTTTTTTTVATASPPPPPPPTNITNILQKPNQFTILLHLLHMTQLDHQLTTQLTNSDQGLTLFAPTDNAFSAMNSGVLNSLSDQQKLQLIQFHIIPIFLSISQFQTVSNPLRTQAGDTTPYMFPLNVTTVGNQVNVSTGVVDTTVGNDVFSDGDLAVYQVEKVLLPMRLFGPPAPATAPANQPEKKEKKSDAGDGDGGGDDSPAAGDGGASADDSGVVSFDQNLCGFIMVFIVMFYL